MSLVTKVVQFKTLSLQLTDTEFAQFFSRLTQQCGRELILKVLCTQFLKPRSPDNPTGNADDSFLDDMQRIASNIIQSRAPKDIQQQSRITKVDELPSPLIGEIASYSSQRSYARFSRTNRSIFVSTNAPNRLTKLLLKRTNSYKTTKLQHHPHLTHLILDIDKFREFPLPNDQSILKRLIAVSFRGKDLIDIDVGDIEPFMNQNCIQFDNLKTLCLKQWSANNDTFCRFAAKFPMITHLDLKASYIDGEFEDDVLRRLFPNLNRLTLLGVDEQIAVQFLRIWSSKVQCLSLGRGDAHQFHNVHFLKFEKLQKLMIGIVSKRTLNGMLKTAKTLKEICFIPNVLTPPRSLMNEQEIQETLEKIIMDQTSLEFVYVSNRGHFEAICNAIHLALFRTKTRKRTQLEIALYIDCREISDAQVFAFNIAKIVQALATSDIGEYLVVLESNRHRTFDLQSMSDEMTDFVNLQPNAQLHKATELGFIIGSIDCKMHCHRRWWNESGVIGFY